MMHTKAGVVRASEAYELCVKDMQTTRQSVTQVADDGKRIQDKTCI